MLHLPAYGTSPSLRATASEGALDHDVLYSGTRPEARTACAHAAVTLGARPRPRYSAAVSTPHSVAVSDRREEKQTLTAHPCSTTAAIGARCGTSLAVNPEK